MQLICPVIILIWRNLYNFPFNILIYSFHYYSLSYEYCLINTFFSQLLINEEDLLMEKLRHILFFFNKNLKFIFTIIFTIFLIFFFDHHYYILFNIKKSNSFLLHDHYLLCSSFGLSFCLSLKKVILFLFFFSSSSTYSSSYSFYPLSSFSFKKSLKLLCNIFVFVLASVAFITILILAFYSLFQISLISSRVLSSNLDFSCD